MSLKQIVSKFIGNHHEQRTAAWLKQYDISIIVQNFRCDKYRKGEIDLIGLSANQSLIFFEVKYRKSTSHGHPSEFATPAQQQRIRHCAEVFLLKHPQYQSHDLRFDVISITGDQEPEWIQNAF